MSLQRERYWTNRALQFLGDLLPLVDEIAGAIEVRREGQHTVIRVESMRRLVQRRSRSPLLRVTTERVYLDPTHFAEPTRRRINRRDHAPGQEDGRVLTCIDQETGQAIAALMFHVHAQRSPLVVTALLGRSEADHSVRTASLRGLLYLKVFLHEVARIGNFLDDVALDARTDEEERLGRAIGFVDAHPAPAIARDLQGQAYLTQKPFTRSGIRRSLVASLRRLERQVRRA